MPITNALQVAWGLVALVVGADVLVRAGAGLAAWLGIRPMMIGLTVVSLGTSVPEPARNSLHDLRVGDRSHLRRGRRRP